MNLLIQSSLGLFTKGTNHKSDKYLKLYFILKGQKTLLSRVSFLITNFIISHQKNNSASNEYDTQKLVDGKDFKNISGINESNSSSSNLKTVNIEGNALQSNIEAIRDDMCAINSEVVLRLKSFNDCLCQCKFGNLLTTSDEIIEAIHNILLTYQLDEEVEKLAKKQLNSIVQITKTLSSFIVQSNEDLNLSSNNLTFIPSFDGCRRRPIGRRRSSNSDIDEEVNHTNPSPLNPNINPNSYINNNSEEIVICRICDEQIPVELFEEHTESCISAYQSETILSEINDALLEIEQGLIDQYLNVEWPDVQKNAISMTMPIEHFNLILHRAILIDPHGADAPEELQSLIYEIDSISHMMENKVITVEGMKIKTALTEKKHASFAFRKEREILKKTRISGSDQTISQAAISDFDIIKRISSGAYARVFLVRKKKTGDIYALKVLPKADVSQKNQVKRILAEKDILLQFNNPYIINFYYSIIGYNNLYLVMEYLPGGDLYSLLKELGSLDEESAKNYTAQIAQALGYLHSNGIIHRDLKPDNILVSASGYLKLTDFGLSYIGIVDRQLGSSAEAATNFQSVSNGSINGSMNESSNENIIKSSSFVGTPDYVAPEIVLNQEHSFTVDWWSLGIMLYEFIMGVPPFHGQTEQETHEMILKGIYTKPDEDEDDVSPECIDIINKLLQLNPKNRLGCNGAHEVLSHPWFSDIDFNNIKPVFKPELKSQEDTGYFQERYEFKGHNDNDIVDDINRSNMHHKIQQQTPFSSNNFNSQRNRRKLSMGQLDFSNIMTSHSSGDAILVMNPKTRNNLLIEDSYQKTDDAEESESSEMAQFPSVSVSQLMEANMNELTARRRRTKSLFSEEDVPPKPTVSKSFLALGSNIGTHKRRMSRPVNFKMLNPERPVTKSFVAESGPENKEKSELK